MGACIVRTGGEYNAIVVYGPFDSPSEAIVCVTFLESSTEHNPERRYQFFVREFAPLNWGNSYSAECEHLEGCSYRGIEYRIDREEDGLFHAKTVTRNLRME